MEVKTCTSTKCVNINPQPLSAFRRKPKYKNGIYPRCKSCQNLETNAYRHKHKEKYREQDRIKYHQNPEFARRKSRGLKFKEKYWPNLSYHEALAEWDKIFLTQGGKCSICKEEKPLDVEHCHITKKVRSLACNNCNTALARIKENPNIALALIEYIRIHNVD